jgi:uncharacterized membrane protein
MRPYRWRHHGIVVAGYAMGGIALHVGLPEQMPPSWTLQGGGSIWLGAPMAAFLLPTAVAVTDTLLRGLGNRHGVGEPTSIRALAIHDAIMFRLMLFIVGVHATILAGLLGMLRERAWAAHIVPVMLGIAMISIGNLLPRLRPTLALGIRTGGTLSDRAQWARTHRLAGYIMVASGVIIVVSTIAVPRPVGPSMILLAGPAALVATWAASRGSARHVRA